MNFKTTNYEFSTYGHICYLKPVPHRLSRRYDKKHLFCSVYGLSDAGARWACDAPFHPQLQTDSFQLQHLGPHKTTHTIVENVYV